MTETNLTNIQAAFEILLEEVEAEIEVINQRGARGFEARDYEAARAALEYAGQVTAFRERVDTLRREWADLRSSEPETERAEEGKAAAPSLPRRDLGRLRRGVRTREDRFFRPILETVAELGGSASVQAVLDGVGRRMAAVLRDVDHEPLASDPEMPRWRNTARWARNSMVRAGLLRDSSRRGVWEITDEGRRAMSEGRAG